MNRLRQQIKDWLNGSSDLEYYEERLDEAHGITIGVMVISHITFKRYWMRFDTSTILSDKEREGRFQELISRINKEVRGINDDLVYRPEGQGETYELQSTGPAIAVTPVLTKTEYIALELTKAWMSSYPCAYYGPKDIYGKYRAMINVIEEDSPHES